MSRATPLAADHAAARPADPAVTAPAARAACTRHGITPRAPSPATRDEAAAVTPLTPTVIDQPAAFARLACVWEELLAQSTPRHVFLTHAWLQAAWSFVADRRALRVLLLRDAGGTLRAALPLTLERLRIRGLPVRQLAFLTDPITGCVRSDLIAATDWRLAAVQACGHWLHTTRRDWDGCVPDAVTTASPLLAHHDRLGAAGVPAEAARPQWVVHRRPLAGSWETYLASLGAHLRGHLRQESRRLHASGAVEQEFARSRAAVCAALEDFLALEKITRKQARTDYTPFDARLTTFHRTLLDSLAADGHALVARLLIDGHCAAVILATCHDGEVHTLNDMYHPDFQRARPGHALRGALLEWAWRQGLAAVDFNGYGPHLERWRTVGQPLYRLHLYSPTARGRLLRTWREHCIPWARRQLPAALLPAARRPRSTPGGQRGLPAAEQP